MDMSSLFRASVKTVSLRRKALDNDLIKIPSRKQRQESLFRKKVESLVTEISKLREFLLDNRKAYLNFSHHLTAGERMTDTERDQIDNGAQEIISTCSQMIKNLKKDLSEVEYSQNIQHREVMLSLIENYLKNVCKIYSEQRAMRVKKAMELRKISKFDYEIKSNDDKYVTKKSSKKELEVNIQQNRKENSSDSSPMKIQEANDDVNQMTYEEELSAEDVQMFESENEQLYNELNTLTEEVKQIESKVVHIAELQEIFADKVLSQDRDLDKLMTNVVGSTENVKDANEQIRQAIQRNAGLRVFILFFLVVMSFSLLFLDWYNP